MQHLMMSMSIQGDIVNVCWVLKATKVQMWANNLCCITNKNPSSFHCNKTIPIWYL